jgi:hypothetical protein
MSDTAKAEGNIRYGGQQWGTAGNGTEVSVMPLPEFESLPRVWLCAESQIKKSRQRKLCREFFIWLLAQKNTWQTSFFVESQTKSSRHRKNTRQRFFYQEPTGWLSAKYFFAKCNFLTLGKENFKKSLFASNFFLSSTYTYTKLMLKFGTISALFAIFKIFTSF